MEGRQPALPKQAADDVACRHQGRAVRAVPVTRCLCLRLRLCPAPLLPLPLLLLRLAGSRVALAAAARSQRQECATSLVVAEHFGRSHAHAEGLLVPAAAASNHRGCTCSATVPQGQTLDGQGGGYAPAGRGRVSPCRSHASGEGSAAPQPPAQLLRQGPSLLRAQRHGVRQADVVPRFCQLAGHGWRGRTRDRAWRWGGRAACSCRRLQPGEALTQQQQQPVQRWQA
jgi:hypothetical protein